MDQEFVTSAGEVFINNKRLLIQDFKFNFWKTAVGEILLATLFIVCVVFSSIDPKKPFSFLAPIIFSGIFLFYYSKQLYDALVKKSYSTYIALDRIKSFEIKQDGMGLEIEVRLHLKNRRYRSILFRKLEREYEPFTELVSQYIIQPQFA